MPPRQLSCLYDLSYMIYGLLVIVSLTRANLVLTYDMNRFLRTRLSIPLATRELVWLHYPALPLEPVIMLTQVGRVRLGGRWLRSDRYESERGRK
ncbi:hypothetical protein BDZ91DRAFT_726534 [Kalaharituber pfeilii]|nr:hypothetical protein BDZ91DRAFT_726534 [Kalaharituber pfeilii]